MAKKILTSEIPDQFPGLNLEQVDDNRFDILQDDYWFAEKEKNYIGVTKKQDKINSKFKLYSIYAWYDVSGWDYWINNMREPNYAQLTIAFENEVIALTKKQITVLENRLYKLRDKVQLIIQEYKS